MPTIEISQERYKQIEPVSTLMFRDPETRDILVTDGILENNQDGTYSFTVRNPDTGRRWKHTVRTVEI